MEHGPRSCGRRKDGLSRCAPRSSRGARGRPFASRNLEKARSLSTVRVGRDQSKALGPVPGSCIDACASRSNTISTSPAAVSYRPQGLTLALDTVRTPSGVMTTRRAPHTQINTGTHGHLGKHARLRRLTPAHADASIHPEKAWAAAAVRATTVRATIRTHGHRVSPARRPPSQPAVRATTRTHGHRASPARRPPSSAPEW